MEITHKSWLYTSSPPENYYTTECGITISESEIVKKIHLLTNNLAETTCPDCILKSLSRI